MLGLPKKIDFLARMYPRGGTVDNPLLPSPFIEYTLPPSPPITVVGHTVLMVISSPSPPPYLGDLVCTDGFPLVLEPYRFSPDSFGWYGGIEELTDPFIPLEEEYLGSNIVNSKLGVEFPLPLNLSTETGDSGIIISAKYVNATDATLSINVEYFDLDDNAWHNFASSVVVLTNTYVTTYIDDVLFSLPNLPSITKLRIVVVVDSLNVTTPIGEVRFNHLTIPYCSLGVVVLPLPPSLPLTEPIQPPDISGVLPPFIEIEAPLPPLFLPPPIFLPPLPPGSEILRPNRDILVRLWQPRPAFMQLNDPLNLADPVDVPVPLYGPATVDIFDETTGNYTGTIRPRVEVGFTNPVTEGPWDALQLRFRATRSRPPQPEPVELPLPIPAIKEPATYPCPSDQTLKPRATDFPGVWQIPPLEGELTDSVDNPKNICFISAPVEVPSGAPGQIALTPSLIKWDAGYNQIKVRLVARARAARFGINDNNLFGVQAYTIQFDQIHAGLPAGAPEYQVQWNPFGCGDNLQAYRFSSTEIRGTGVLQTNIDIHAEFFLYPQESDNLEVQVSTDGINYYGAVVFDLAAFRSTVIYYRIALNKGGLTTPTGNLAVGAALIITGPYVVTGFDVIHYPRDNPPFIIDVKQIASVVPLVSQCRVGVSLQGNMELMQSLVQYTGILTSDWNEHVCELTWNGFWSSDNIKDLRIRISPEALLLEDDVPFIDISALDVIISPYCPGLSQSISRPLIKVHQVDIVPTADVSVTGWNPVPAWIMLVGDPILASDNDVLVDPRIDNQLLVEMAEPSGLPDVMVGYVREWITVEAIIQARIITWSSLDANLLVSTTFGQEQRTIPLTTNQEVYFVTWNYDPGLSTDQINRMKMALIANSLGGNGEIKDPVEVAVSSLTARLTFQDVLLNPPVLPPSLPPFVDTIITVVESDLEIFSCGSLGDCGAPQGRIVAKVRVTNPDSVSATVNFIVDGRANIRVSDLSNNVYNLSQTIAGNASITFFIYGWVGDSNDPFPVDPTDGGIIISLVYSAGVDQVVVDWYYIGL